MLILFADN